jgi:hypothetical protein
MVKLPGCVVVSFVASSFVYDEMSAKRGYLPSLHERTMKLFHRARRQGCVELTLPYGFLCWCVDDVIKLLRYKILLMAMGDLFYRLVRCNSSLQDRVTTMRAQTRIAYAQRQNELLASQNQARPRAPLASGPNVGADGTGGT